MPVDPNEPVYCVCRQGYLFCCFLNLKKLVFNVFFFFFHKQKIKYKKIVSFGEMVCCEAPDCNVNINFNYFYFVFCLFLNF